MIRLVGDNEPDIEVYDHPTVITGPSSYGNGSNNYVITHNVGKEVKHVQLRNGGSNLYWYNRNRNTVGTEGTRGFLIHSITLNSFDVQLYQDGSPQYYVKAFFY